jgi:hypothetical protein
MLVRVSWPRLGPRGSKWHLAICRPSLVLTPECPPRDQKAHVALPRGYGGLDLQAVLGDDMGDDSIAVADRLAIVDDVRQSPAGPPTHRKHAHA